MVPPLMMKLAASTQRQRDLNQQLLDAAFTGTPRFHLRLCTLPPCFFHRAASPPIQRRAHVYQWWYTLNLAPISIGSSCSAMRFSNILPYFFLNSGCISIW